MRHNLLNYTATIVSIALVITSLAISWVLLAPIDVITDWTITPDKSSYVIGDTAVLDSSYTKLRDIKGEAHRYIECKNPRGFYIRYELNVAKANAAKGTGATGIIVKIPDVIPQITLPTECRFAITVDYQINRFRTHTEVNTSSTFTLNPNPQPVNGSSTTSSTDNTNGTTTTTNSSTSTSASGTNPAQPTQQPATTPNQPQPVSQPSLLERAIQIPINLVKEVL